MRIHGQMYLGATLPFVRLITMKKIKIGRTDKNIFVYKIVNNSKWYIIFWIDMGSGTRFEKNLDIRVKVKKHFVNAEVNNIKSEDGA